MGDIFAVVIDVALVWLRSITQSEIDLFCPVIRVEGLQLRPTSKRLIGSLNVLHLLGKARVCFQLTLEGN